MTTVHIENHGDITFGVVGNRSSQKLPWYKNASLVPDSIRAEAERVSLEKSADMEEHEWRMKNWSAAISGYSYSVRCYYPWFMMSPAEALEWMSGLCMHNWVRGEDHTQHDNKILGTYDHGYMKSCSKCGNKEYVRTSYNNYSGD